MNQKLIIPTHVSIIMDGNGRWAKMQGRDRINGHKAGVESVRSAIRASVKMGVKYLSLYAFSQENWGRPQEEVSTLMNLMLSCIAQEYEDLNKNGVKFLVLGDRGKLSLDLITAIDNLQEQTKNNTQLTLIIFLSYSGKWDILQAAKKLVQQYRLGNISIEEVEQLQEQGFDNYLVTCGIPNPDIIIRTSGEQRLSNYLLWQGAYSELVFIPKLWPDFREEDFEQAIIEYNSRERRFGKV